MTKILRGAEDHPSTIVRTRKILFAAGALRGGGAENQLFQIANGLSQLGHDVTVATLVPQTAHSEFRQLSLCGAMTKSRVLNALMLGRAGWRLCQHLRLMQPDVMISWLAVPTLMAGVAMMARNTPWIVAIRNSQPERMRSLPTALLNPPLRKALTRADRVIANSVAGLEGYARMGLLVHTRTAVIANCIDTARFRPPSHKQRISARENLGIPHGVPVVAYVGRDAIEKRIELLTEVLAAIAKQNPDAQAVVVGPSTGQLAAVAAAAGVRLPESVRVLARMQEIEQVYWAADVLVLTSRREGSPNVIHEARACGLPIVSTDCGDVRETMLPRDRVVPPDSAQFASAIMDVLAAAHDRQAAPQLLSPRDCATRWATEIDSMLAARRSNLIG